MLLVLSALLVAAAVALSAAPEGTTRVISWGSLQVPPVSCANVGDRVVFRLDQDSTDTHSITSGARDSFATGTYFDWLAEPGTNHTYLATEPGLIPFFSWSREGMNSGLLVYRALFWSCALMPLC